MEEMLENLAATKWHGNRRGERETAVDIVIIGDGGRMVKSLWEMYVS